MWVAKGTFVETSGGTIAVNNAHGRRRVPKIPSVISQTLSSRKEQIQDPEVNHRVLEERLLDLQRPGLGGSGQKSRFRVQREVTMNLSIEGMKLKGVSKPHSALPPHASEAPKHWIRERVAVPRRLLNTMTLEIHNFAPDEGIPDYAILSHRWTGGEISYQDYVGIEDKFWPPYSLVVNGMLPGYIKIVHACRRARMDGFCWIWIDTCCIKQNDHEDLSRNIKSMHAYYGNSRICYAYLLDVTENNGRDGGWRCSTHRLEDSEWFSRGWTLQELLAPREVIFVDRDWNEIGRRNDLAEMLSTITLIPAAVIRGEVSLQSVGLIKRLCWSNNRRTAKPEDMAYCLLGILGVAIEPIYGEGVEHAFERIRIALIDKYPGSKRELEQVNLYTMIPVWSYYSRMLVDEMDCIVSFQKQ